MLELALATVVVLELVKALVPPVHGWAKMLAAAVLAVGGGLYLGLDPITIIAAWGLAHVIHAGTRLLLAVSDYYRVESVLRASRRR